MKAQNSFHRVNANMQESNAMNIEEFEEDGLEDFTLFLFGIVFCNGHKPSLFFFGILLCMFR